MEVAINSAQKVQMDSLRRQLQVTALQQLIKCIASMACAIIGSV